MGPHYFFFTRTMSVTVTCAKGSAHSRVTGYFAILKQCTLHSASVITHPETLYEGFVSSIFMRLYTITFPSQFNISSIKHITNSISEFKLSNHSELESAVHDSLPVYLSPYVHYPSVIVPIVLVIVILIPLCCIRRKALTLYTLLKTRVAEESTSHEMTLEHG